ncbi:hypothetical protein D3C81_1342490 [compost metagenome]
MAPASEGSVPSTGNAGMAESFAAIIIIEPPAAGACPGNASSRPCSSLAVLTVDSRVSTPVSQPIAIATTASNAAAPRPRRIHSPAPRWRFKAANTRPPIQIANANEVAAPSA